MARYGEWDEEHGGNERDRWSRERGGSAPYGRGEAGRGREWRGEAWRGEEPGRWADDDWRRRSWDDDAWRGRGGEAWGAETGRTGGTWEDRDRWTRDPGRGRDTGGPGRPGVPWVERPQARDTRGLHEWEDRGPLQWLGDKFRDATGMKPRGPKGYRRSDERIHDEVCERLARCGVDASDVEVKVDKGEVTLTGHVAQRADKWRLEDVADDVFGVEDVHNQLRVRRIGETGDGGAGTTH